MKLGLLFDLDGTLLDTAPDFEVCLNALLQQAKRPTLPLSKIRQVVSQGTVGLIKLGFQLDPEHEEFRDIQDKLFTLYMDSLGEKTEFFPGIPELIDRLEQESIPWGIVTNKPARFTTPLIAKIFDRPLSCVVSGDTLEHAKPHPAPVLHACEILNISPGKSLFIGDDARDVQAGLAAGLTCCVVNYGYIEDSIDPKTWNAHHYVDTPLEIYPLLSGLKA